MSIEIPFPLVGFLVVWLIFFYLKILSVNSQSSIRGSPFQEVLVFFFLPDRGIPVPCIYIAPLWAVLRRYKSAH